MPQLNQFPQTFPNQSMNLQQQIALKQLEKQTLELLLLQQQFKSNPFSLQLHYDNQTSTSDLPTGQRGILRNPCGNVIKKNEFTRDLANIDLSPARKLSPIKEEVPKTNVSIVLKLLSYLKICQQL